MEGAATWLQNQQHLCDNNHMFGTAAYARGKSSLRIITMGNTSSSSNPSPAGAQQACTSSGQQQPTSDSQQAPMPECPVKPGAGYKNAAVYNVYGQRLNDPNAPLPKSPLSVLRDADVLDPRNNMPLEPNQLPCPGQRKPLSTERVASTIPKGGTESTWLFPSPQMVFNGACHATIACNHACMAPA